MPNDSSLLRRFHRIRFFNGTGHDVASLTVQPIASGTNVGSPVDCSAVFAGMCHQHHLSPATAGALSHVTQVDVTVVIGLRPSKTFTLQRSDSATTITDVEVMLEEETGNDHLILKGTVTSSYVSSSGAQPQTETTWIDDVLPPIDPSPQKPKKTAARNAARASRPSPRRKPKRPAARKAARARRARAGRRAARHR